MILRAIYMADLLDSLQGFEVRDCDCCHVASKEWFQNADLGRGVIDIWKTNSYAGSETLEPGCEQLTICPRGGTEDL